MHVNKKVDKIKVNIKIKKTKDPFCSVPLLKYVITANDATLNPNLKVHETLAH